MNPPIYFFNGWGMDEHVIAHLGNDYPLQLITAHPNTPIPEPTSTIIIIAWSFGVYKANQWLTQQTPANIRTAIAINGTPYGIHPGNGIPETTARATLAQLTDTTRPKLYRRIFGRQFTATPQRDLAEQREELRAIIETIAHHPCTTIAPHWQHAWLSDFDPIFAHEQQQKAWQNTAVTRHNLDAPHHLLSHFSSWQQFLELNP